MTVYKVQVWFEGDVGPASIEYTKIKAGGNIERDHNTLTKRAQRKFPNAYRVRVETVETSG